MTEQEIRLLITEYTSLTIMCTQFWLAIVTALIVISYTAGASLDHQLRKLVVFLYLIFALSPFATWITVYYEIRELRGQLVLINPSYTAAPVIVFLGRAFALLQTVGFVVGTAGALKYFLSTKKLEST